MITAALTSAFAPHYELESELGRGGMAGTSAPTVTAPLRARASTPASHKPGGDDISLTAEFLFLERTTPTRICQRHKLSPS